MKKISISVADHLRPLYGDFVKIDAEVFGAWAAHRRWEPSGEVASAWAVTYVPLGKLIAPLGPLYRDEALAIASALDREQIEPSASLEENRANDMSYIIESVAAAALEMIE